MSTLKVISCICLVLLFINCNKTVFAQKTAYLHTSTSTSNLILKQENIVPNKEKKQINVLSLDGGGVKSITTLKVLEYIENKTGKKITDMFDVIAGTSSGGVLALYLTDPDPENPKQSKYSVSNIIQIYENDSRQIFKPRSISKIIPTPFIQTVIPGYESKNVEKVFTERFKENKLSDSVVDTVILTYNSETTKPFTIKSYDKLTQNTLVKDAAIATAAAPFFFEPLKYNNENFPQVKTLIDGGLIAKNPSLIVYFELKKLYPNAEINMLSLGSGMQDKQHYNYQKIRKWGFTQYVLPMISFMLDGGCNTVDYQMSQLIPDINNNGHYYRFQIPLDSRIDHSNNRIDDTSDKNMSILKGIATKYINQNKEELDSMVNQIMANK